jgi:receptor protein-tyrosine kinase
MRAMGLSFVEAGLHLGLITQQQVVEAVAAKRDAALERPGIIETFVQRQSAARSIVVVPDLQAKPSEQLIIAHDPGHSRSEGIRALRTELLLRNEPGLRANMLALLSPAAGEGRSQLAAELAIAFSQLGRRTLLVDADLRRPRQHQLFGIDNTHGGLTQALTGGDAPKFIGVVGFPHLAVLMSGPPAPNPSELLGGGYVERLFAIWRHDFNFVVIDTPPIGEFSDGLLLAALTGRVLLLGRAQVTTHRGMKDMLRRLVSTQSRILGSVINTF